MGQDTWLRMLAMRGQDAHALILPFVLAHTGVIAALVFGGESLQESNIQLMLAAWIVLGSAWTLLWLDGCLQDFGLGAKDMDPEIAATHMGQSFAKMPFTIFRVFNAAVTVLIVAAELNALYG